jgi:hypothetical protein
VHAVAWAPLTILMSLALLPAMKGAIVAWQWANYMHGFDPHAPDDDLVPAPVAVPAGSARR